MYFLMEEISAKLLYLSNFKESAVIPLSFQAIHTCQTIKDKEGDFTFGGLFISGQVLVPVVYFRCEFIAAIGQNIRCCVEKAVYRGASDSTLFLEVGETDCRKGFAFQTDCQC